MQLLYSNHDETDSKIDLLDAPETVSKKIKKAVAAPKVIEENGVLAFVEYVLLPAAALRGKRQFLVDRERDGLEPLIYTEIADMHRDYQNDVVCPLLLAEFNDTTDPMHSSVPKY